MKPLTKTQFQTLEFLISYQEKKGYMPSIQEISKRFGLSISSAWQRLSELQKKKVIKKKKYNPRWIKVYH